MFCCGQDFSIFLYIALLCQGEALHSCHLASCTSCKYWSFLQQIHKITILPRRQQSFSCLFIVLLWSWNGSSDLLLKIIVKEALKSVKSSGQKQTISRWALAAWHSTAPSLTVQDSGAANDTISSRQKKKRDLYILPQYQTTEVRNQEARKKNPEAEHTV